jgi:hypothetical protein
LDDRHLLANYSTLSDKREHLGRITACFWRLGGAACVHARNRLEKGPGAGTAALCCSPRPVILLAVAERRQGLLGLVAGVERQLVGHQGGGVGGLRHGEIRRQVAVQETRALELGEAGQLGLLYVSRWSDGASAGDFTDIYAKALTSRYRKVDAVGVENGDAGKGDFATRTWATEEGNVVITRRGEMVVVSESLDDETRKAVEKDVLSQ